MGKILVIISVCPMPPFFTMWLALYLNYTKFESDISKASIITWYTIGTLCPLFRSRFVHSSMWLGLQTVPSLERCPSFGMSFIQIFLNGEVPLYNLCNFM